VPATNAFVKVPKSTGVSLQQENWQFGDVASSEAPTLAPSGFIVRRLSLRARRLDDLSDSARLDVNGAVDGFLPIRAPDPALRERRTRWGRRRNRLNFPRANASTKSPPHHTPLSMRKGKELSATCSASPTEGDEKAQVAQQSADSDATVNKRFKIALPESERGEAKEKLQVATARSSSVKSTTTSGTDSPRQKPADVQAATEDATRSVWEKASLSIREKPAQVEPTGITDVGFSKVTILPPSSRKLCRKQESALIEAKVNVDAKEAQVEP